MNKIYQTFIFKGVHFLAVNHQSSVHIIDIDGNNYGSWSSVAHFKQYVKKDESFLMPLVGRATLTVSVVS